MEQDSERGGVGGQDDDLGDTTVESLGGLVGTLLQLATRTLEQKKCVLRVVRAARTHR